MFKKKITSEKNQSTGFQDLLHRYSNGDRVTLAGKQTPRSTEQNGEPRNSPTQIYLTDWLQRFRSHLVDETFSSLVRKLR